MSVIRDVVLDVVVAVVLGVNGYVVLHMVVMSVIGDLAECMIL